MAAHYRTFAKHIMTTFRLWANISTIPGNSGGGGGVTQHRIFLIHWRKRRRLWNCIQLTIWTT
jgi:hypothetical protein